MFRYLPLIAKNCWRNRRRTILTILSVGASLSLLGILVAVYAAVYVADTPPDQALRLAVRNKVSLVFSMPEAYGQKIRQVPGVREVITDGKEGLLADPVDPEDLGGKIRILLADDRRRAEMGRAGRETVEKNFSVQGVVDRIEAVYRELVAKRGSL